MDLQRLLKLSRPRFWFYLAGPYAVGYIIGTTSRWQLGTWDFFYPLFYFLIPANIFLYGINDMYDIETDIINPKKQLQESHIALADNKKSLQSLISLIATVATLPLFFIFGPIEKMFLLVFLLLAYFYSAPPLRFKAKPFLDSFSNVLYVIPAFIGYYQITNRFPPWWALMAAFSWAIAMHLFSAVPDIHYDRTAGISTTATYLGRYQSLMVTMVLWSITAIIATAYSGYFAPSFIYPVIPFWLLLNKNVRIINVYWWFPYITAALGFLLFWFFAWRLL